MVPTISPWTALGLQILPHGFFNLPCGAEGFEVKGNPECWNGPYTYESCCDVAFGAQGNPACWDGYLHTHAICCSLRSFQSYELASYGVVGAQHDGLQIKTEHLYDIHKTSFEKASLTPCSRRWLYSSSDTIARLNIYTSLSGIPLEHPPRGWGNGHRDGKAQECLSNRDARFFLVTFRGQNLHSDSEILLQDAEHHFGICVPEACDITDIVQVIVPQYVVGIWNVLRIPSRLTAIHAWEWPQLLHLVHDSGVMSEHRSDTAPSLYEQVQSTRKMASGIVFGLCLVVLLATSLDSKTTGSTMIKAFSLRAAFNEFVQSDVIGPGGVNAAADLVRVLATWGVAFGHLIYDRYDARAAASPIEGHLSELLRSAWSRSVATFAVLSSAMPSHGVFDRYAPIAGFTVQDTCAKCSVKLLRKLARQVPCVFVALAWQRYGDSYIYPNRPLSYVDGSLGQLEVENGQLHFLWSKTRLLNSSPCQRDLFNCAFLFDDMLTWQVQLDICLYLCFSAVILTRACMGTHVIWCLLLLAEIASLALPPLSRPLTNWILRLAWTGVVWTSQAILAALPKDCPIVHPHVAVVLFVTGWLLTAHIEQGIVANRILDRWANNLPLVFGTCLMLECGQRHAACFASVAWRVLSKLSFGTLMFHGSFLGFMKQFWSESDPPFQTKGRELWLTLIVEGPSYFLWMLILSGLVYVCVQRPARILLEAVLPSLFSGTTSTPRRGTLANTVAILYLAYFLRTFEQ